MRQLIYKLLPRDLGIDKKEVIRIIFGILLGLILTSLLSKLSGIYLESPIKYLWLLSTFAGTAVLLFATPNSPLVQPWSVLGGSTISAFFGIFCYHLLRNFPILALTLAVVLAVFCMMYFRCLHPPGAAISAFIVMDKIENYSFIFFPLLTNAIILILCAIIYNNLTGKKYPNILNKSSKENNRFNSQDLDKALNHYNQVLDISRNDLEGLLNLAGQSAFERTFGKLKCKDIMTKSIITINQNELLEKAWGLMHENHIKALPVINEDNQVIGIISMTNYINSKFSSNTLKLGERLKFWIQKNNKNNEKVSSIMITKSFSIHLDNYLINLLPLFSKGGCHHLVIINDDKQLVGIITQTDLIRALGRAVVLE